MKVGIIIVFDSNHEELLTSNILEVFNKTQELTYCLVNNKCSEAFGNLLQELADECKNVNLIHIKKRKTSSWAVRAGSRFMNSHYNVRFLGYIIDLNGEQLINAIQVFSKDYKGLRKNQNLDPINKLVKQSFFQKVFSVKSYYEETVFKPNLQ